MADRVITTSCALALALSVLAAACFSARAQERVVCGDIPPTAFWGGDRLELQAMRVAGRARRSGRARRVHFGSGNWDRLTCPGKAKVCPDQRFVVSGDVVLVSRVHEGFACAVFTDPKDGRTTSNWLPARSLAPVRTSLVDRADWAGTWRRIHATGISSQSEQRIEIKALADSRFSLRGVAATDPAKVQTARNVLSGSFDVVTEPKRGEFAFSIAPGGEAQPYETDPAAKEKSPCRLWMWLVGPYLVVRDNHRCADGTGFSGAYRRG